MNFLNLYQISAAEETAGTTGTEAAAATAVWSEPCATFTLKEQKNVKDFPHWDILFEFFFSLLVAGSKQIRPGPDIHRF